MAFFSRVLISGSRKVLEPREENLMYEKQQLPGQRPFISLADAYVYDLV